MGPLTKTTALIMGTKINSAIEDAKGACAEEKFYIRDEKGKEFTPNKNTNLNLLDDSSETSELYLMKNLNSSTDVEIDLKDEEENDVRRSKRLTKTNPVFIYKNASCHVFRKTP